MLKTETDHALRQLLREARVIAVVGYSDNPYRPSSRIANFLKGAGYRVYAVNPTVDEVDGEPAYPTLAAVPEPIDIVNVFRRSEYLADVVENTIAVGAKAVWAQLGVYDEAAADRAHAAGLDIIMDACIKVEYVRLMR